MTVRLQAVGRRIAGQPRRRTQALHLIGDGLSTMTGIHSDTLRGKLTACSRKLDLGAFVHFAHHRHIQVLP